MREEYSTTIELQEKILILERIKILKEHITEKYKEGRSKRINHIAQQIRENVNNGGKIWEVKRRLEKKVQTPYSITNTEGIKLDNRSDIQEEYTKYYKKLLKTREPDNESERIIEEEVNKNFQEIIRKTNQTDSITNEMVKKAIAKLKNKRASDRLGWRAEWLKEGGEEIVKSLSILFNRIEREQRTLIQWRQTTIKSIYKGGNKANISESQRGIFLINIISKVYELVKITQNDVSKMSKMQAAGRKERSAMDNLIIMNTIIENQRAQKLNTYMFFADAVKCFDKLWLKDCLLEMYNLGYDPNTLKILYEMNKETDVIIKTTVGNTDNIQVKEVVKQGTIFGPIMCCAETSTVNSIGEEVKYRYGKINIGMPVFMDDIATAGKAEHIRKGINNCARMEREKKISFGLKKTKYMIVKTGREEEEEINETVKAGRIQRTDKCKYLGITISTDGQLTEHIKELNTRCDIINREICAIGAKTQVGKEEVRVKLKLFETCLMPALLYGMEAWKNCQKQKFNN